MRGALLIVLSAGAFLQCLDSATLPPNPCPNLFQYLQDKNGIVYGRVMLDNDRSGAYEFSVNMSIAAYIVGMQSIKPVLGSTAADIEAGRPLVYNIYFPTQDIIPRVTKIQLNNKVYCSGLPEELSPRGVTEMWASTYYYRFYMPSVQIPASPEQKLQPGISLFTQQPSTQNPTTSSSKPWLSSKASDTTEPLPWESWQQPSMTSDSSAPLPWESWLPAVTTVPAWLFPRNSTSPSTSASLSSSSGQPTSTSTTTNAPLRTTFSAAPTTSVSLAPSPLQPSSTTTTTSASLSSKPSTYFTKPSPMLSWLSLRPSAADTTVSSLSEDFSLSGKECGLSVVNSQKLVVDENDFVDGQFPWLVAILYRNDFDYKYKCTGSLVSNRHVITAGHCVGRYKEIENYLLVFGKKKVQSWAFGAEQRELQNIIVHPDYNDNKGDCDIAILTVKKQIEFEAHIKPVCLWQGEEYVTRMAGTTGTVVGWWMDGKKKEIDAKKVDLPIVSQTECKSVPSFSDVISSGTFCAGSNGKGPCHGDSGAGFVMQKDGRWILRGVVSTALGDLDSCDVDNYFVFVDIDKVMSWLKQAMM